MAATRLRVAAAQYPIGQFSRWAQAEEKLTAWISQAAREGAQLLLFPEYGSMELASLFGPEVCADLARQLDCMQSVRGDFVALHGALAKRHGVYIVAASFPVKTAESFVNRAHLCAPSGAIQWQDKRVMTRFENERWGIAPGAPSKVFRTPLGNFAINLCYDVEFPLMARAQVEAGADMILVPSCTDTLAGYHRVKVGCQARALENQCVVVQSPTVGNAPWSEAVDVNVGAAGVYGPPDRGFPDDGVLIQGTLDAPGWVYADIDLARVEEVRRLGQVFNYRDWPKQTQNAAIESVELA